MVILLYGEDTFRSREKLRELKDKFRKEVDSSGLNLISLDGEKLNIDEFSKAVKAVSFLARKRMVVIENLISKNKNKDLQKELLEMLDENSVKESILVFWEDFSSLGKTKNKKIDENSGRSPLMKKLLQEKYVYEFKALNESQLHKWVKDKVKGVGLNIDNQAAKLLISFVGNDLWQLNGEIDKLISYARAITAKDILTEHINLLVNAQIDDNIFNLIDAVSQKNKKLASKLINDQLDSGISEMYVLSMLTRQFRILLQTKEVLEKKPGYSHIASLLGLHPFVAQKAVFASRNFEFLELKRTYRRLLDIDFEIKTGYAKPKLLLDLFVVNI